MLTTSFPRYPGDFAGKFVYDLAQGLARRGVEVRVVAPHDGNALRCEARDRLSIHRFVYAWPWKWQQVAYGGGIPSNIQRRPLAWVQLPGFGMAFFWAAWRACAHCDLVHVHWAPLAWIGLALRMRYRVPVVVSVHGTDVRALPAFLIRPALARAEGIVATSLETEVLLQRLGIGGGQTNAFAAIPLPIDEEAFRPGIDPGSLAEELGLQGVDDVVTFVGRLNAFKDPMTLVRAVPLVLARCPEAHFVIVGDGPLAADLRDAVASLGLQRTVHLVGARGDVERFLALSRVFVALSPVENAWSTTIAEAMHMRVPCIITRAGQTERLFTHMQDAYLIDPQDQVQLAGAILSLFSEEDRRKQLAQGAVALLHRHGRDTESIVQRTLSVYHAVLGGEGRGCGLWSAPSVGGGREGSRVSDLG